MTIAFTKVAAAYGWLGNMAPYPIHYMDKDWRTTEALFQAMRFRDEEIIELIRKEKSPMSAKMIAKSHKDKMTIVPMSEQDLDNMRLCLNLKLEQHDYLVKSLLDTGDHELIEDVSKRPHGSGMFWGAAWNMTAEPFFWDGHNWLGKLWMELRSFHAKEVEKKIIDMTGKI